jgi:hypothetical protein
VATSQVTGGRLRVVLINDDGTEVHEEGAKLEGEGSIELSVKPANLTVACATCFNHTSKLSFCANCITVSYCSRECQMKAWKSHKVKCKELMTSRKENKSLPIEDHPSWKRLPSHLRKYLREYHARDGCIVPWPGI